MYAATPSCSLEPSLAPPTCLPKDPLTLGNSAPLETQLPTWSESVLGLSCPLQGSPPRVISVASIGHKMAWTLPLEDLNWERRTYSPAGAYVQSKLSTLAVCARAGAQVGDALQH